MPIPERSAGREKTSNVTQVGGSEVLDRNTRRLEKTVSSV